MLFFHAFTGCDTVSAFCNKGKKTAWQTWDVCPEASPVFSKLSQYPLTVEDGDLEILRRFIVQMYDRSSTATAVDEARLDMFARKQRPFEAIPPTRADLLPSRLVVCGPKQPSVNRKQRVLLSGDCRRLVKNGTPGQPTSHNQQLQTVDQM